MIRYSSEFKTSFRSNLKNGHGKIRIRELVSPKDMVNCRLFCEQCIPAYCSIGKHTHYNETEYYIIQEGTGQVTEKTGTYTVSAGDVVVTGHGAMHSITNTGSDNLIMLAIIITY